MIDQEPEAIEPRQRKKRSQKQSDAAKNGPLASKRNAVRSQILEQVQVLLPNCPTNPQELVNAWSIPANEAANHSVLIFRQVPGQNERVLIDKMPVLDYDLETIAGKFGPGIYYVRGTAGQFSVKAAKFNVSQEYAASRGFGRLPDPPKAADVMAIRTLEKTAQVAGIDAQELINAMERSVEAGLDRRLGPRRDLQVPHQAPFDAMETQFAQVEKMYSFMERMEARAMDSVSRRMGLATEEPGPDPNSWAGILSALAPVGMELVSGFMRNRANPEPVVTNITPLQVQAPPPQPPKPAQEPERQKVPSVVSRMTDEEKAKILPALGMLRPFLPILLKMTKPGRKPIEIAEELEGYIPDNMAPAMCALSELTRKHGIEAMGLLGSDFMSAEWLLIVHELEKILEEKYKQE